MSVLNDKISATQLNEFMNKHGISPKELGSILGVTIQAVTLWIEGKREVSVTTSRVVRLLDKYPMLIPEFSRL